MSKATRLTRVRAELVSVQTQIDATLARGAQGYTTEVQGVTGFDLTKLYQRERSLLNEEARLARGTRFGKIGFCKVSS